MDNMEKITKLMEKTGVNEAEASQALASCGGDLLDAILLLEREGKINRASSAYTTGDDKTENAGTENEGSETWRAIPEVYKDRSRTGSTGEDGWHKFVRRAKSLLALSIECTFGAERRGKEIITIPVLVLILLLVFAFWAVVPLLVIGLFLDCRYRFHGVDHVSLNINDVCDKAADAAKELKKDIHEHNTDH
jgi:hypothetical protein